MTEGQAPTTLLFLADKLLLAVAENWCILKRRNCLVRGGGKTDVKLWCFCVCVCVCVCE